MSTTGPPGTTRRDLIGGPLGGPLRCAAAMTILGASVPMSRLVIGYPVLTGQAMRYALAAAVFALIARLRKRPRPGLSGPPQPDPEQGDAGQRDPEQRDAGQLSAGQP